MTAKDNIITATKYDKASKDDKIGRCVYVPCLARNLLRMGYEIIDIKPNRTDRSRTVFVFKYTDTLDEDLKTLISKIKEKRENSDPKAEINEMVRAAFFDDDEE